MNDRYTAQLKYNIMYYTLYPTIIHKNIFKIYGVRSQMCGAACW